MGYAIIVDDKELSLSAILLTGIFNDPDADGDAEKWSTFGDTSKAPDKCFCNAIHQNHPSTDSSDE